MWPNTNGIPEEFNHATPEIVNKCLSIVFAERLLVSQKEIVIGLTEQHGITMDELREIVGVG